MTYFLTYLAKILAVMFVFAPHEFAHAFIAYKNGDPTAKFRGRMTINPVKHIDPIGFISCVLVGFGWAKPVPIDPYNFRNYRKGMFTTAIAGIVMNYIIAFFAYLFYVLVLKYLIIENADIAANVDWVFYIIEFIQTFFYILFVYSLCSVIFNLIPLNPLDGFRVVEAFTRQINPVTRFLRNYGNIILIVLIAESFLCSILSDYVYWFEYLNILGYVMTFAIKIVGYPIQLAWSWILKL